MRNTYIYKYIVIYILICFLILGCVSDDDDTVETKDNIKEEEVSIENVREESQEVENDFLRKYLIFVENHETYISNVDTEEEQRLGREKYFEILKVPEKVYGLDYNYELIKRIEIGTEDGLGKWFELDTAEQYPMLMMVTENGDLCFSESGDINASKYLVEKDEWIRYGEGNYYCPEFIWSDSIFYEDEWHKILLDKNENYTLYFENETERINLLKYNELPVGFFGARLVQPLVNNICIWQIGFSISLNDYKKLKDKAFLYYDLNNKEVINEFILPGTDRYYTFDAGMTPVRTIDSQDRIYLRLFKNPSKYKPNGGNREGHIMILDIENDALYNIHHPYYTEINENDNGALTTYVVGEDDNIYFQLVTEQAYYVYKIVPLWDSVEETEYNPRFIEFYPELQEIWDSL